MGDLLDSFEGGFDDVVSGLEAATTYVFPPLGAIGLEGSTGLEMTQASGIPDAINSVTAPIVQAIEDALPSSTSITVWLVLIVVGLIAVAFVVRETAG
jgi:hypothetical protein